MLTYPSSSDLHRKEKREGEITMNKPQKKKNIQENRNKYRIPGGANYQLRTMNAIHISSANSVLHEIAKSLAAYELHKWGDIIIDQKTVDIIAELEKHIESRFDGWVKQPTEFITEAVIKKEPDRRVDLVKLDDDTHIEFETNKKVKKEGAVTIYLVPSKSYGDLQTPKGSGKSDKVSDAPIHGHSNPR